MADNTHHVQEVGTVLPELNDVSRVADHTWPMLRAARNSAIGLVIVAVISLSLWGMTKDLPGIYGALIGVSTGGGFMLLTIVSILITAKTSPQATLGVVLGSWLLKAVILLVVLFVLKDKTFYDNTALALTVIASLVVVLGCETYAVTREQKLFIS